MDLNRRTLSAERAAELVAGARLELASGNIGLAETLCREVLTDFPESAECWNVIGVIAAKIGLFEHAATAFQRALVVDPSFDKAADNLQQIKSASPPPRRPSDSPGFLVIKAWGQGFWSDVDHVLGQILIAELTGRTPIVHWGSNSKFRSANAPDAFGLYFEPLSTCRLEDLRNRPDDAFWPPKWSARNLDAGAYQQSDGLWSRLSGLLTLGRSEEIVVSDYFTGISTIAAWIPPDHPLYSLPLSRLYRRLCEKLRPLPAIQARVSDACARLFNGERVLAVHARGTDKADESPELALANTHLLNAAVHWAEDTGATRVFLLSDSNLLVARFHDAFGPKLLMLDARRSNDERPLHFQTRNGHTLGIEIMIDTYLATRADWFLGNGDSNVSAMIEHLRLWPDGRFRLVRPSIHYRRQLV